MAQQLAAMILVGPVESPNQDFNGTANLITKLIRDFLLVVGARSEHRFERLVGEDSDRAAIEVEFHLMRAGKREPLLLQTYREREASGGSRVGDSVEAFNRALQRILERLLVDLPEVG